MTTINDISDDIKLILCRKFLVNNVNFINLNLPDYLWNQLHIDITGVSHDTFVLHNLKLLYDIILSYRSSLKYQHVDLFDNILYNRYIELNLPGKLFNHVKVVIEGLLRIFAIKLDKHISKVMLDHINNQTIKLYKLSVVYFVLDDRFLLKYLNNHIKLDLIHNRKTPLYTALECRLTLSSMYLSYTVGTDDQSMLYALKHKNIDIIKNLYFNWKNTNNINITLYLDNLITESEAGIETMNHISQQPREIQKHILIMLGLYREDSLSTDLGNTKSTVNTESIVDMYPQVTKLSKNDTGRMIDYNGDMGGENKKNITLINNIIDTHDIDNIININIKIYFRKVYNYNKIKRSLTLSLHH